MAAFTTRTLDQSLKRGSKRAALNQFWTPQTPANLALTTIGFAPQLVQSDGQDIWVACGAFQGTGAVSCVRASDGKLLETWTVSQGVTAILVAMGRVFVASEGNGSTLYMIDPRQPAGSATPVVSGLPDFALGIAFDGSRIWLAMPGVVAIITPGTWTTSIANSGFTEPRGIIFDGSDIWVTDFQADKLYKLDSKGAILQSITVGDSPVYPIFDGTNIWVPNGVSQSITVVRASTGTVLASLTGNGLSGPNQAAFDGERILVTNSSGASVSLWKATDFTPLGSFSTGASGAFGACSDGIKFWVTGGSDKLIRF